MTVASLDNNLVDIVFIGIRWLAEIGRRFEGQDAGCIIDVEQVGIRSTDDFISNRTIIRVGRSDGHNSRCAFGNLLQTHGSENRNLAILRYRTRQVLRGKAILR